MREGALLACDGGCVPEDERADSGAAGAYFWVIPLFVATFACRVQKLARPIINSSGALIGAKVQRWKGVEKRPAAPAHTWSGLVYPIAPSSGGGGGALLASMALSGPPPM